MILYAGYWMLDTFPGPISPAGLASPKRLREGVAGAGGGHYGNFYNTLYAPRN